MFHNIRDSRRKLFIVFITLTAIILIISVGFAALSTTLNISTTNVTQTPQSWDVGFVPETVTPEARGTSSIGLNCPTATTTKTTITIGEMTLSKPEDTCAYTFQVKNNGTLHANLQSILFSDPVEQSCTGGVSYKQCGNIVYHINRADGSASEHLNLNNGYICSEETYNLIVEIDYVGDTLNSTEITQTNGKFTLLFEPSSNEECQSPGLVG